MKNSPRDSEDADLGLLDRARGGDRDALEALLLRHRDRVYRFGVGMCGNPDDAEDVLQETLIALARGVQDFRGASSLSTWLYSVARSFCIKRRRKRKAEPAQMASLDADPAAGDIPDASRLPPDDHLGAVELERAFHASLETLDPEQREIILLRDVEGLSAAQVAEILGVTVAAVKSRLHRARARLRDALAPWLGDEPRDPGCPDVLAMYSQHLEGEISAELCTRMEEHLGTCSRCRSRCNSLERMLSLCSRSAEVPVPKDVQLRVKRALLDLGA